MAMNDPLDDVHPLAKQPTPPRGEDLPYDDGEPMETKRHRDQMNLLVDTLDVGWGDRDDYFAGGNMALYFSETQARNQDFRAPDVFVVLDTEWKDRKGWVVWEEGGRTPDVVIELLSPSTEAVDRGRKKQIYAQTLKVRRYYLYDPWTYVFEGYRLDVETLTYERIEPDANGDLECSPMGLRLGIREGRFGRVTGKWLRWIDEDDRALPTDGEAERRRADDAERRLAELEARVAELEK